VQKGAIPTVPPERQTEEWKALKPPVKAANVPKWAQHSQDMGIRGMGDRAGKGVMIGEMCTEDDKEGRGGERQSR
jgi:hypothetical protein